MSEFLTPFYLSFAIYHLAFINWEFQFRSEMSEFLTPFFSVLFIICYLSFSGSEMSEFLQE